MRILIIMFAMLISLPAMAGKPGDGTPEASPPLQAVFIFGQSLCSFRHIAGFTDFYGRDLNGLKIVMWRPAANITEIIDSLSTPDELTHRLLEYFIRINGLALTPDDFRDPATGEFVCTNEKLFSLL